MMHVCSHDVEEILVQIWVGQFCEDKSINVDCVGFIQKPDEKVDVWQPSLLPLKGVLVGFDVLKHLT